MEFTVSSRQRMPGSCILRKWIFLVVWMCARLQSGPVVPTYCLIFFKLLTWHEFFHTVIVRISGCEKKKGNFIFQIEVGFSKLSYWEQTHQPTKVDVHHRCNVQLPQQWLTISLFVSSSTRGWVLLLLFHKFVFLFLFIDPKKCVYCIDFWPQIVIHIFFSKVFTGRFTKRYYWLSY